VSNRKKELTELVPEESLDLVSDVIDEVVFLENKLNSLKRLPFIEVHPQNSMKQRNTPAAKLYKEFLQQYINCIKVIETIIYRDKRLEGEEIEESPLRKWFNAHSE
jgi:hypothetical protein